MALPIDEIRSEHAAAVPVYVRAAGAGYELADTATNEALGSFDTARQALMNALERPDVAAKVKRANLRTNGEPDGEWRWLDASATEDEPVGGSRITDASLWEMAAGLNARKSAIPVNGGGAPEGLATSEPHGDAKNGDGAHPANGWAHLGLVVIESDARAHLYLLAELLPEVAKEVDRGRLAYGSIYFAFESLDEDDNHGVSGAVLISHALTNDPAVTTLTAGSERRRGPLGLHVAFRTWRTTMPTNEQIARDAKQTPKARVRAALEHVGASGFRGPIGDLQSKVAAMLGISEADLASNPWALEDACWALSVAAKVETKIEAVAPPAAPPAPAGGDVAAGRAARAEGEPATVEEENAQWLAWARGVLGKPEATAEEAMAELDARKEEVGKALGTDVPPTQAAAAPEEDPEKDPGESEGPESEEPPAEEPDADDEEKKKAEAEKQRAASRTWVDGELRSRHIVLPDAERDELATIPFSARSAVTMLLDARAKIHRFETREWLDAEIAKRESAAKKLGITAKERDELVDVAIVAGREIVTKTLNVRNAPPSGSPLDGRPAPDAGPATLEEAVRACWGDAEAAMRTEQPGKDVARHHIHARAQRLAYERWPGLKPAA